MRVAKMFSAVRVPAPGPPGVMKVDQLTKLLPKPNEVLVRVHAVGINPVETYLRSGNYTRPVDTYPYTPGNDASGVVEAVGEGVSNVKAGDRVYTLKTITGSYAEYTVASSKHVRPIPANVSFKQAAALSVPYYTAYRALFQKANIKPGRSILVHGATGAVGVACLQMSRAQGLTVIGSAGSDSGAAAISQWCHHVVRHGSGAAAGSPAPAQPPIINDVLALTGGKGVDYVITVLANVNLNHDLKMLARNGTAVVVGSRGDVMITPREFITKEIILTGVGMFAATDDDYTESACYIEQGLSNGALQPVVGRVFQGLESAPAAHEEVIAHSAGTQGKIVIEVVPE